MFWRLPSFHPRKVLFVYLSHPIILKFWTQKLFTKLMPQPRNLGQFVLSHAICFYVNFYGEPKLLVITLC